MALTQRAAKEAGIPIRFTRRAKQSNILRFRKQTEAPIRAEGRISPRVWAGAKVGGAVVGAIDGG